MSFIFSKPSPASAPPPAPAPAPVVQAPVAKVSQKDRLQGSANRRRGSATVLTGGDQTVLGATGGKSLLGA